MVFGFQFNGRHSDDFNLTINNKDIPLMPPVSNRNQNISGQDGAWDYGASFGAKPIPVDCTIEGEDLTDVRKIARRMSGWLNPKNGAQQLIFDDEPDILYFARLESEITLDQIVYYAEFTLNFICYDPYAYGTEIKRGSFSNSFTVDHSGEYIAMPLLKINHTGGAGAVTATKPDGTQQALVFTDDSPSGQYIIDGKKKTKTVDGEPAYDFVEGHYLFLPKGQNQLANTGNVTRTEIEFRDTYL